MYYPSRQEFTRLAREASLIPVYREWVADMETPVSLFRRVVTGPPSFLLESVEGSETLARYSFLGTDPLLTVRSRGGESEIRQDGVKMMVTGNPLEVLRRVLACYRPALVSGLPRFYGGAVGYLGYDIVRFLENLPDKLPEDPELPDSYFLLTRLVVIYDHVTRKVKVVANTPTREEPPGGFGVLYDEAVARIETLVRRIQQGGTSYQVAPVLDLAGEFHSNTTKEEFEAAVRRAKEYIAAGDIFQVVLSQRLETDLVNDPFDVYRCLRAVNPSPYLYYLDFGELKIAGSSPEMLVRLEGDTVTTRPIAGTRPTSTQPEENDRLQEELLKDEKERAEHIMLVDLGRNDLGRVCRYGSVQVSQFMEVEGYSHVMHIVSEVQGKLREGLDAFDALAACFPAGTVSGAPKVRAMEIINELEPTRRGPYAGAVGYFGFSGNMDTCITIRTVVMKGQKAYVQAGAGIVADSVPELEYEETMNKARALLAALDMAREGIR